MQLRQVTGMTDVICSLAPLTGTGAGAACGPGEKIRYELGSPVDVTVAHAAVATEFDGVSTGQPMVVVQLDKPGTATFAAVTGKSVGRPLAILLHGRILNAPIIRKPIADGRFPLTTDSSDQETVEQLAHTLNGG
jgi:preprotein translocase subunit SecD